MLLDPGGFDKQKRGAVVGQSLGAGFLPEFRGHVPQPPTGLGTLNVAGAGQAQKVPIPAFEMPCPPPSPA